MRAAPRAVLDVAGCRLVERRGALTVTLCEFDDEAQALAALESWLDARSYAALEREEPRAVAGLPEVLAA